MIKKLKSGTKRFAVYSHKTGKLLGKYKTRLEAEAAIRRHKRFK